MEFVDYKYQIEQTVFEEKVDQVVVTVTSLISLDIANPTNDPNQPSITVYREPRTLVFDRIGQDLVLTSQSIIGPMGPVTTQEEVDILPKKVSTIYLPYVHLPRTSTSDVQSEHSTDAVRLAIYTYARQYAINYNPSYRRFQQDCTNFVSQALYAGGWTHASGWYTYDTAWWYNGSGQTLTWVNVDKNYLFAGYLTVWLERE